MNLLNEFKQYLLIQPNKASSTTVKNYLADVRKFVKWYELKFGRTFSASDVSSQNIVDFKEDSLSDYSALSVDRSLSSLRKLFTFLKLEGHISHSPFEQLEANKQQFIPDPWRLKDFKNYLYVYNASHLTIKNYVIDLRQFLSWVDEVTSPGQEWEIKDQNVFTKLNPGLIADYKKRLVEYSDFSPASINRKLSSIRRFMDWAGEEGLLRPEAEISNAKYPMSNVQEKSIGNSRVYSGFPPLRLIQKTKSGILFIFDETFITPLARVLENLQHGAWIMRGRPVFSSIVKGQMSNVKNLSKSFYAPSEVSVKYLPLHQKLWHHARYSRPDWYKRYHSNPISSYLHFSILIIFTSLVAFTLYNAYVKGPEEQKPALAAVPTAPLRILSFQGRLTDNSDNPITTATDLRFTIYNNSSSSGSARLWEEIREVTPDSDGIFSVLLGSNGSGGSAALCNGQSPPSSPATGACGIMSSLFYENNALWLAVTVEATPELTPRQQIATVAFATNSETLQGLEPITNSSATTNVVLALNSSGNLAIGGSASPIFQATGGTFTLQGTTTVVSTTTGSNGQVQIIPAGLGKIDLQKPIQNTTNNNNISTAVGALEVNDLFAVLATSSGQSAFTLDQTSTGPLISASVSGVAKFTVSNAGGITAEGNLDINGTGTHDIAGTLNLSGAGGLTFSTTGGISLTGGTISDATDGVDIADDLEVAGAITLTGLLSDSDSDLIANDNFDPNTDNTFDLGDTTNSWKDLFLTGQICFDDTDCASSWAAVGIWTHANGAFSPTGPYTAVVDLLLGSNATASAKFGLLNVAAGTPVASISGNSGNIATYLTGLGNLQTTNGQTLTLGGINTGLININNKSGSAFTTFDTVNSRVGIGDTSPLAALTVGSGDLFQVNSTGAIAAATGITSSGSITFSGFNANNNALYATVSTGVLAGASTNTSNLCLISGASAPSWGSCSSGLSNDVLWSQSSGAIYPNNSTVDLLVGGQATTSAKFAFINVNSGTPTASISGNLGLAVPSGNDAAIKLDLLKGASFGIRTATTGQGDAGLSEKFTILNGGNVGIGTVSPDRTLDVEKSVSGDWLVQFANTHATAGHGLLVQAGDSNSERIAAFQDKDTTDRVSFYAGGNAVFHTGNVGINTTSLTNGKLVIVPNTGNYSEQFLMSGVAPNANIDDIILGFNAYGSATAPTRVDTSHSAWVIAPRTANATGTDAASNIYFTYTPLGGGSSFSPFYIQGGTTASASQLLLGAAGGYVGIGTASPIATLDVRKNSGTIAVASISGATSFAGMVVDNSGLGDIFTASSSGLNRFVVTQGGNVGIGTTNPLNKLHLKRVDNGLTAAHVNAESDVIIEGVDGSITLVGNSAGSYNGNINFAEVNSGTFNSLWTITRGVGTSGRFSLWNGTNAAFTSNNELLTVLTSGNVGIGITAPISELHVTRPLSFGATGKALAIFDQIENQDILTASAGGATRFKLDTNGYAWAERFVDLANASGTYYLDPAAAGIAAVVAGKVGIGATTPAGTLDVQAQSGTLPVASISGATSFAGLVIDQSGNGDIFTASRSGASRFTIAQTGNITHNSNTTTGTGYTMNLNSLTTGTGLSLLSTSTALSTGGLMSLYWNPGSSTTATGDLLSLDVGTNGVLGNIFNVKNAGSTVFSVSQTAVTSNLPTSFTAAGDVSIAYDISFTNPTASYIKSAAPLYITAGETFNSSDLNLTTYNKGRVEVNTEALEITGSASISGSLGIGTTSPSVLLHLVKNQNASTGILLENNDGGASSTLQLRFNNGTANSYYGMDGNGTSTIRKNRAFVYNDNAQGVSLQAVNASGIITMFTGADSSSNERMRIAASGAVGIANTAPLAKLAIGDATSDDASFQMHIGTGNAYGIVVRNQTNTGVWASGTTYDFFAAGAGTDYGTSSSIRWKRDIRPIDNALEKILNINGVYFNWDEARGGGHGMGMIAENVGQYVPEIVSWDPDAPGFATGMDYGHLTPVLVEAIKEQQGQIARLDSQSASSEARLASQGGQLTNLESDLSVNDSGNLSLAPSVEQLASSFGVRNTDTNKAIDRISAFKESVVGKIRAGALDAHQLTTKTLNALTANVNQLTTESFVSLTANISDLTADSLALTTDGVTIAGQTLRDYITFVVNDAIGESRSMNQESGNIAQADIISPLSSKDLTVKLPTHDSKFVIRDSSDSAKVTIDSQGNASFSGKVSSQELEVSSDAHLDSVTARQASISGTLRASRIIADQIEGLDERLRQATNSSSLSPNTLNLSSSSSASASPSAEASESADSQLSMVNGQLSGSGSASFASISAVLANVGNLNADTGTFMNGLISFGQTSFYEASIAEQLSVGAQLTIASRSINVLGGNLELQPLRLGGVNIADGGVIIDRNGNLRVNGNANFAKDVAIEGRLLANIISPLPGKDLVLELASQEDPFQGQEPQIKVNNSSHSAILTIDPQGNLKASGSGTFNKLNFDLVSDALALSDTEVIATGSAGTTFIKSNKNEVTLYNSLVTENSLIYITPVGPSAGESLFLRRQTANDPDNGIEGSFTVGISSPVLQNTKFNFLIVN